jgi:hypothetical protein
VILNLQEAWITHELTYTSGREDWHFHTEKPDSVPELFVAAENRHVPGKMKRIMYVEVTETQES